MVNNFNEHIPAFLMRNQRIRGVQFLLQIDRKLEFWKLALFHDDYDFKSWGEVHMDSKDMVQVLEN